MEKVFDYVIGCSSLKGIISDMKVIEDFESRPHKAATFVVKRGKERREWNEQQLPKAHQEEARKRKVGKKAKKANKGRGKTRSVKK